MPSSAQGADSPAFMQPGRPKLYAFFQWRAGKGLHEASRSDATIVDSVGARLLGAKRATAIEDMIERRMALWVLLTSCVVGSRIVCSWLDRSWRHARMRVRAPDFARAIITKLSSHAHGRTHATVAR